MPKVQCPKCLHEFDVTTSGKRICAVCLKTIKSGHKWTFRPDSKVQHRNCDNPISYDLKATDAKVPHDGGGKSTPARGAGRPRRNQR